MENFRTIANTVRDVITEEEEQLNEGFSDWNKVKVSVETAEKMQKKGVTVEAKRLIKQAIKYLNNLDKELSKETEHSRNNLTPRR